MKSKKVNNIGTKRIFFELLEREIDFQEDYEKIEDAIINEKYMLSLEM